MRLQKWSDFADQVDAKSAVAGDLSSAEAASVTKTIIEQCVLRLMQAITIAGMACPSNVAVASLRNLTWELLSRSLACGQLLSDPLNTVATLLSAPTVSEKKLSDALQSFDEGRLR